MLYVHSPSKFKIYNKTNILPPCKLKSNKKDNINKEEFSQCHRILRDRVPVVFPNIRLILQHEDWHAMQ